MDLWLINTHNGVKDMSIPPVSVDDYPAIKNHLDNYYDKLKKRADQGITPYNLRNCIYMDEFSKQKLFGHDFQEYRRMIFPIFLVFHLFPKIM